MSLLDQIEAQLESNADVKAELSYLTFNKNKSDYVGNWLYQRKVFNVAPVTARNSVELLQEFMENLFSGVKPLQTQAPKKYGFGLRIGYLGFEEEIGSLDFRTTKDYRFSVPNLLEEKETREQTFSLFRKIDVYVYPNEKAAEMVGKGKICARGEYNCYRHPQCYRDFVPNILLEKQSLWQGLKQRLTEDKEVFRARHELAII